MGITLKQYESEDDKRKGGSTEGKRVHPTQTLGALTPGASLRPAGGRISSLLSSP